MKKATILILIVLIITAIYKEFKTFELVQINNQMVTACNQSNNSYCD